MSESPREEFREFVARRGVVNRQPDPWWKMHYCVCWWKGFAVGTLAGLLVDLLWWLIIK